MNNTEREMEKAARCREMSTIQRGRRSLTERTDFGAGTLFTSLGSGVRPFVRPLRSLVRSSALEKRMCGGAPLLEVAARIRTASGERFGTDEEDTVIVFMHLCLFFATQTS